MMHNNRFLWKISFATLASACVIISAYFLHNENGENEDKTAITSEKNENDINRTVKENEYIKSLNGNGLYAEINAFNDIDTDVVEWSIIRGKFYLFLPSCVDTKAVVLRYTFPDGIAVDGEKYIDNSEINLECGEHTLTSGSSEYKFTVLKSENVPSVYITLDDDNIGNVNSYKEYEASGEILFADSDGNVTKEELSQIKGRGNTSWNAGQLFGKYPYNIKLKDSLNLFDMGDNKNWCLIAQVFDKSLIRNVIMNDLASQVGLPYTPNAQNVDLYCDGSYMGTYLLSQKPKIGKKSLININDLEKNTEEVNDTKDLENYENKSSTGNLRSMNPGSYKYYDIPKNPDNIEGGYLLEFELDERYPDESCGFVTDRKQLTVIKEPGCASMEQVCYIKDYMQRVEDAVYSDTGYNSQGEYYTELIDVESFVKVYLINEFTMNIDAGATSFYMYKDVEGLLCAGPIWDYDWAMGSYAERDGVDLVKADRWFVKNKRISGGSSRAFMATLCTHDDFWEMVKKEWNENFKDELYKMADSDNGSITKYGKLLSTTANMNFTEYDIMRAEPMWGSSQTGKTYEENIEFLREYVIRRADFMSGELQ